MLRGIYSAIYGEVNVSVSVCLEIKGDYIGKKELFYLCHLKKDGQAGNFLGPSPKLRDYSNNISPLIKQ
jgi:hypothetical protein